MKLKILYTLFAVFMSAFVVAAPMTTHAYYPEPDVAVDAPVYMDDGVAQMAYTDPYSGGGVTAIAQTTDTIDIQLDTTTLFEGANTMLAALSSPYMLIAGFGLGVAILAAIMKAVTSLRL